MFDLSENLYEINFPEDNGVTAYYSPNILKSEAVLVKEFLTENDLSDYSFNSRLWKPADKTL